MAGRASIGAVSQTNYYKPGPDFASGYGRVNALAAYQAATSQNVREGQVDHNNTVTYNMEVEANTQSLKVTLVWSDPAAVPNAVTTLINDLDLELVAPDGAAIHLPWVLDPNNPAQTAIAGVDSINNVEQVLVSNPATGTWMARVKGTNVPQGPQSYSVILTSGVVGNNFVYLPLVVK